MKEKGCRKPNGMVQSQCEQLDHCTTWEYQTVRHIPLHRARPWCKDDATRLSTTRVPLLVKGAINPFFWIGTILETTSSISSLLRSTSPALIIEAGTGWFLFANVDQMVCSYFNRFTGRGTNLQEIGDLVGMIMRNGVYCFINHLSLLGLHPQLVSPSSWWDHYVWFRQRRTRKSKRDPACRRHYWQQWQLVATRRSIQQPVRLPSYWEDWERWYQEHSFHLILL